MTDWTGARSADRAQLVLVAAAVLALALVPMTFAYLQLGYHGDVDPSPGPERTLGEAEASLERAVEHASAEVDGEYEWQRRNDAVEAFRDVLADDLETIERLHHPNGVVVEIDAESELTASRETVGCPSGPMRSFGPCDRVDGVLVQERAGETAILADGFRLAVATQDGRATLEVVVVVFE